MMPRAVINQDDVAQLLRLQVAALFHHDAAGRIVAKNKPVSAPAPRLFIGRSLAGNIWRFRNDVPDDLVATLAPMLEREPVLDRLDALPMVQTEIVAELARHQPIIEVYSGPAWRVPATVPSQGRAIPLASDGTAALRSHFPTLAQNLAAVSPCAAVLDGGVAVSVCFSARISPHVAEAGLKTVAAARGRGYGPDAVAAWAAATHATGRLPLYSTSWDNLASRRVAETLALIQYGVDLSIY